MTEVPTGTSTVVRSAMAAASGEEWAVGVELFDRGDIDGSTGIMVSDFYLAPPTPAGRLALGAVRAVLYQWTLSEPSPAAPYYHWRR